MIKCGLFHTFHTEFKDFHDLEKSFCFCLFLNTFFFCFPDCAGNTEIIMHHEGWCVNVPITRRHTNPAVIMII